MLPECLLGDCLEAAGKTEAMLERLHLTAGVETGRAGTCCQRCGRCRHDLHPDNRQKMDGWINIAYIAVRGLLFNCKAFIHNSLCSPAHANTHTDPHTMTNK